MTLHLQGQRAGCVFLWDAFGRCSSTRRSDPATEPCAREARERGSILLLHTPYAVSGPGLPYSILLEVGMTFIERMVRFQSLQMFLPSTWDERSPWKQDMTKPSLRVSMFSFCLFIFLADVWHKKPFSHPGWINSCNRRGSGQCWSVSIPLLFELSELSLSVVWGLWIWEENRGKKEAKWISPLKDIEMNMWGSTDAFPFGNDIYQIRSTQSTPASRDVQLTAVPLSTLVVFLPSSWSYSSCTVHTPADDI